MDQHEYRVARVADVKEKKGLYADLDGEEIALFKVDGTIYAISNVCAHQHFSKLHEGIVEGMYVTCPMHGWTYDVGTGRSVNGSGRVKTYRVIVRNDDVFVVTDADSY